LEQLWPYQFTLTSAPLTEKIASKLYDFSGGIPGYIVKIFQESQAQALLLGQNHMDERIMQRAIDMLAIKVPKSYSGGTYISDFEIEATDEEPVDSINIFRNLQDSQTQEFSSNIPRLYAKHRGRKAVARDAQDLMVAFQAGVDMIQFLQENQLLEEWPDRC